MNTKKRRANGATDGKGNRRRRKNGTGTLERRGDKWLARWYVYDSHGRRVRQSQTIEAATLDQARAELRRITEGDSLITREKILRDTRDFFRCLWRVLADHPKARLVCNPWEKVKKREVIEHTRRELTTEELAKVCGAVTGEMRTLFAVGIYTGLRLGDCALLDWGEVDLVRRRICLIPRKTRRHAHGKPVIIPIHQTLAAILDETPAKNRKGYVVPELAELYERNPSTLSHHISAVFAAAGISTQSKKEGERAKVDVGFHSLRHTFVSLSANAGAPLAIVQAIVGHSNPAMTRHYFHEQESALTTAVAALPDVTGVAIDAEAATSPAGRTDAARGTGDTPKRRNAPTGILRGVSRIVTRRAKGGGCMDGKTSQQSH